VKDIRDLTDIWCVGWKDRLVERGLSPASINDAYLAALRGTCSWAKKNLLISQNPVSGINVSAEKKGKTRPKGFTQGEALTILKATLAPVTQNL
jgi:site-specific recombinase XerC